MDSDSIVAFLIGSFVHVIALVPVLFEICWSKDCTGISAKTQILHEMVLFTRATLTPDGSRVFVSWLTFCAIYSIYCHRKPEHKRHDDVRIERLVFPCLIVAYFIRHDSSYTQFFVSAAAFLEALAIIPQTRIIQRARHFEAIMYYYVGVLGCSKLYHAFVLTMKYMEEGQVDLILVAATAVQLFFYVDFFVTHLGHIGEIEREAEEEEARIIGAGCHSERVVECVKVVDVEKVKVERTEEKKDKELKEVKSEVQVADDKKVTIAMPD